ncbi:PAS domain-containing protein [Paracoccus sp. (in: a-proteobacteria)]|uniref:PAS domain-containing protein n=1 Tax=Paracoccus sp. TaxID=267 RepID=UPI0026DFA81A|nr:PAS domain-containing protein [Paracoccus sp. (in: a-proteobacteria)]MDO5370870.1 PAS domain-containing protein [Paracoccus sp. (in: a-proteobacteria)]
MATLRQAAERIWAAVERVRAETRLRQIEARLMAFGEASSDLLWIRNAETLAFEYLSPAAERIFGVARDKMLEGDTLRNWLDMILPEDRERARAKLERVRQGERLAFEYRIACPDSGQVRLLRDTVFPVRGLGARLSWIAGLTHDATEETASTEQLAVLVVELQHRTRNLLGVVGSVMARTLPSSRSLKDFSARMGGAARGAGPRQRPAVPAGGGRPDRLRRTDPVRTGGPWRPGRRQWPAGQPARPPQDKTAVIDRADLGAGPA